MIYVYVENGPERLICLKHTGNMKTKLALEHKGQRICWYVGIIGRNLFKFSSCVWSSSKKHVSEQLVFWDYIRGKPLKLANAC